MLRFAVIFLLFLGCASAQTGQPAPASDPQALSLATQSITALTGGGLISDVVLKGNAISTIGSDYEFGSAILMAKGVTESRIDLNLNSGPRSDVRSAPNGIPQGAWRISSGSVAPYAEHNCFTDASWFFPALSSITQTSNPSYVFRYVGLETRNGLSVQHIQVFRAGADDEGLLQQLSTIDFFLDPTSMLPLVVTFNSHADNNFGIALLSEIRFASYQPVNGAQVPFHFQKLVNGSLFLDVTITNATLNSGILDSSFTLE